jgi:heme/copper-type cytochrome/quinol oxidase subunit 1
LRRPASSAAAPPAVATMPWIWMEGELLGYLAQWWSGLAGLEMQRRAALEHDVRQWRPMLTRCFLLWLRTVPSLLCSSLATSCNCGR